MSDNNKQTKVTQYGVLWPEGGVAWQFDRRAAERISFTQGGTLVSRTVTTSKWKEVKE